jgi:hypothetical protein
VKLLLVRTPHIGNTIFDGLTGAEHLVILTITVYILQAGAYLTTCETYGAAPCNTAVTLINLNQLLFDGERFKFKYTGLL